MTREELTQSFDPEHILFATFFIFSNKLQAVVDNFYEGITCKQFFLAICISVFQEGSPTINELSELMGSSHQNVKQIANKLEKSGFITIYQDSADKRKLRVALTDKMRSLSNQYEAKEQEFFGYFYDGISKEEIQTVLKVLNQLENNLQKIGRKSDE